MSDPIRTERHGDVLVIVSDNPPVNALGAAVRHGLEAAIKQAAADASVAAVVIRCDGRTFFAGADITEFGKPPVAPGLPELVDMIEATNKPVVAAIHGTALGGGCEVALGCHYRIAVPSAKLGTPEVKLGLLPGAGGTQRLPRVAGIAAAAAMCATGEPLTAQQALDTGLVDRLAGADSLAADAIAFAKEVAAGGPRPSRDLPVRGDPAAVEAVAKANARKFRGFEAPAANLECVRRAAAGVPFAQGVAFERREFARLLEGTQSAAQRHIFFAERQASRIDDVPADTPLRPIARVGIIGAGTMGGGIAMNFLSAGIPVVIVETQQEALDRGTGLIRRNYEASAAKGRLRPAEVEAAMAALSPTLDLAALADCDLVIEAVYENMDVKLDLFARLDAVAKPGAILASNTSYLDIDAIAAATGRPQDVLGMHFFSPANVMKLLEVVRGAATAPDVLATVMALAKRIRKVAVVAGVTYGFIGNRMLMQRQNAALDLLMEGATPEQVDRVHTDFGMPMGPFQMSDLAGVDIGWHRDPARVDNIRDALAADGRWGQKTGAGFYDYDERRTPSPSARTAQLIADFRAKAGAPAPRAISDQEIVERTLYPIANEGARIVEEGKAQRASDVDVVWIYGYGWPVYRGGPLFWAEHAEGAAKIVAGLERHGVPVAESLRAVAAGGTLR